MTITPYLTFNGNCEEAIELYKKAFDIKVSEIMCFGDMPSNPNFPMPEEMKNKILQATLEFDGNIIRLSDSSNPVNTLSTDLISIAIQASMEQIRSAFDILQIEGKTILPLQETFFSPCYGIVVDKFGVKWQLAAIQ